MHVINATVCPFSICHAACKLVALNVADKQSVNVTVHQGASGTFDGVPTMPWAVRLEKSICICEGTDVPCINVLDAPPTAEISEAIAAVTQLRTRLDALRNTDKLLIMSSTPDVVYPQMKECANRTQTMTYSNAPWAILNEIANWELSVNLQCTSGQARLHDTFSLLLGTHRPPSGPYISTAAYPNGFVMPQQMLKYITFSTNVVPGSAHVSLTRGVTAKTTDGAEWSAAVMLNCEDRELQETEVARHVRRMLTSSTPDKVGGAYFSLCSTRSSLPIWARRAMQDVHAEATEAMVAATARPPLCRAASIHSPWH